MYVNSEIFQDFSKISYSIIYEKKLIKSEKDIKIYFF